MDKTKKNRLKKWHKWLGVPLAFFAIMFAVSGIVLNHRNAVSGIDVSRKHLPEYLQVSNWNQSSVKSTVAISNDSLLMYGMGGIWLTDPQFSHVQRFEAGLKPGADNRNVAKIVRTSSNEVFAVTTFDLYQLSDDRKSWINISHLIDTDERLTDAAVGNDTLVVLSRSEAFAARPPFTKFEKIQIAAPNDYDGKVSLFRTMWLLHSGELFGIAGKIFVDLMGLLLIFFSVTGLLIFLLPKAVRRIKAKGKDVDAYIATLRPSYKWHGKLGYWLVGFILILFISGTFLRPPLMISIIRGRVAPLPFTTIDSRNAWHDRLRCINFDAKQNDWLMYTSEGFFSMKGLQVQPQRIKSAPAVSVMGVNVMQPLNANEWVVGSFDGLVLWNRISGKCTDYQTRRPIAPRKPGPPSEKAAITGFSADFKSSDIIFKYTSGAKAMEGKEFIKMPDSDTPGRISLWHLALEVHTGRIYQPLIGIFSDLYVFLSGISLVAITLTGFFMYRRKLKKKRIK